MISSSAPCMPSSKRVRERYCGQRPLCARADKFACTFFFCMVREHGRRRGGGGAEGEHHTEINMHGTKQSGAVLSS